MNFDELGHQARLRFDYQSLNYNGTTIQCRAESDEGCSFESDNRTLIVEGTVQVERAMLAICRLHCMCNPD